MTHENPFKAWMEREGGNPSVVARQVQSIGYEISRERIRLLALPYDHPQFCMPTWPLMAAIYDLTDKEITPNHWADVSKFRGLSI